MKKMLLSVLAMSVFAMANSQGKGGGGIGGGGPIGSTPEKNEYVPKVISSEVKPFQFNVYGNSKVNLTQGKPIIDIPLYTLKDKGVEIPIRLSYDASGIKVNDFSSVVGLKWNLFTGGDIKRTINKLPDEQGWLTFIHNENLTNFKTHLSSSYTNYSDLSSQDQAHLIKLRAINDNTASAATTDYMPDYYSINTPQIQGNFTFDKNRNPFFESKSNLQKLSFDTTKKEITVKNTNGVVYTFGKNGAANYYNYSFNDFTYSRSGGNQAGKLNIKSGSGGGNTSFLLNTIGTHHNETLFTYAYKTTGYQYSYKKIEEGVSVQQIVSQTPGSCSGAAEIIEKESNTTIQTNLPLKITGRNEIVDFVYDENLSNDIGTRLKKIVIKSAVTLQTIKVIEFVYENYQGSTKFKLKEILFKNAANQLNNKYQFVYQSGSIPNAESKAMDINGYYNGATSNAYYVDPDLYSFSVVGSVPRTANRKTNTSLIKNGVLKEIIYPTGGKSVFEYTSITAQNFYGSSAYNANQYMPGLYIDRMYDLDDNGTKINNRKYTFKRILNPSYTGQQYRVMDAVMEKTCTNYYQPYTSDIGMNRGNIFATAVTVAKQDANNVTAWTEEHTFNIVYNQPYLVSSKTTSTEKELTTTYTYDLVSHANVEGFSPVEEKTQGIAPYHITVKKDKYQSFSYLLKNEKTVEKFGNQLLTQEKKYEYDTHFQLKKSTMLFNGQKQEETTFEYPYTTITGLVTTSLKNKMLSFNMLPVIQQQNTLVDGNTSVLATNYTKYQDWGSNLIQPKSIQTSKGSGAKEERAVFHEYYSNGNIKEVSKKEGTHIVYIWGYNKTQPIAKIENATYANVSSYVSNLQNLSNLDINAASETNLRTALKAMRTGLLTTLPKAQVTTFTYNPLIGLTSVIDARGRTMYYHYDAFNRLQYVKDEDGNVVSENQYNYKN